MAEAPLDTSADAHRVQITAYRRLGAQGRTEAAFRLIELARDVAVAGIRNRHPDYDEERIRIALVRLKYGDELARAAFPGRELPPP